MRPLDRIGPLARVLVSPGGFGAALRWRPFSITAFQLLRSLRAEGLRPGLILDGGANVGQFARAAAETFPEARVISFEPLPEIAAQFRSHFEGEPRVRLVEAALGAAPGTLAFHRNAYSLASSALQPLAGDGLVAPHVETFDVDVTTLDAVLDGVDVPPSTLLKLDLQGFELEALRGGHETLSRVGHVLLEVALRPSYEGEPTLDALTEALRPYGFAFLRSVDDLHDASGEHVQMDALFGRTP